MTDALAPKSGDVAADDCLCEARPGGWSADCRYSTHRWYAKLQDAPKDKPKRRPRGWSVSNARDR